MITRTLRTLALSLGLILVGHCSTSFGQYTTYPYPPTKITCPFPVPQPQPQPLPQPVGYQLGVTARTVPVEGGQPVEAFRQEVGVRVAPGYGQTVYGQMVLSVVPDSPAYHAGLEPGDIIVDANGIPMDNGQNLQSAIRNSNGRVEMKVLDVRTNNITWVVAIVGQPAIDNGGVIEAASQVRGGQPAVVPFTSARLKSNSATTTTTLPDRRPPVLRQ
jgi:membrane-associated protease RseP (regulator of RpoE activity)